MIQSRTWTFKVTCKVQPGEKVYIVGSCDELGNWNPQDLFPMEPENAPDLYKSNCEILWKASITLPRNEIQYRYCVANTYKVERESEDVFYFAVKSWETNIHPRIIPALESNIEDPSTDNFGYISSVKKVDEGWLDQEHLVEFKLFNSNIYGESVTLWKRKHRDKKCFIKMTPINLASRHSGGNVISESITDESTEAELSEFRLQANCMWPSVSVSVLSESSTEFKTQDQFGVCLNDQMFIAFRCRIADLHTIAYLVDFYVEMTQGETPQYIGCSYILPSNLKENAGVSNLPITSEKHLPIGQFTVHYLVVQPLNEYKCNMEASYARYWKESWKGLEVGHRGSGNSFHSQTKNCSNIRENTIASLKYASENGADMVEFDVQLSKDLIPLIYHDFHVFLEMKHKEADKSDIMQVPVKDLTLQQLQALKVYHKSEKGSSKFSDSHIEDHQPFPTLHQAMDAVALSCGFNIEIKWTMRHQDGTYELDHPLELNRFIDKILAVVLENAGHRKIIFSSFHPDICTMIRMKQNRFPVLFLTQGCHTGPPTYDDLRTRSIQSAVFYSASANILGVNVQTEDLLRDTNQIQLAYDHNLVAFCWGDQNSDKASIELLKNLGLHGIIYDKIDVYITKKDKRSIFLCDDKHKCKCIPTARRTSPIRKRVASPELRYDPALKSPLMATCSGEPTSFQGILANKTAVS